MAESVQDSGNRVDTHSGMSRAVAADEVAVELDDKAMVMDPNRERRDSAGMLPDTTEVGLLAEHTENIEVGNDDVLKRIAWRIKRSVSFFVLYIVLIILNAFVLIWEIAAAGKENHAIVIILEAMINIIFIVELSVEILTQGRRQFFASTWNRVDFVVCCVCAIFFIIFLFDEMPKGHRDITTYLDGILIGIRYSIQLFRMMRFVKSSRQGRGQAMNDVVFDNQILTMDEPGDEAYLAL